MKVSEIEYAKRRALTIFDKWVKVSGYIEMHSSLYSEIQGCIEDAVHCGAQAAQGVEVKLDSEEE